MHKSSYVADQSHRESRFAQTSRMSIDSPIKKPKKKTKSVSKPLPSLIDVSESSASSDILSFKRKKSVPFVTHDSPGREETN